MTGQVRGAIGEVICIEEGEGIYQSHGDSDGDEEGVHGMPRSIGTESGEDISKGMLGIEDWRFCCSAEELAIC